jgi:hypothetical protein
MSILSTFLESECLVIHSLLAEVKGINEHEINEISDFNLLLKRYFDDSFEEINFQNNDPIMMDKYLKSATILQFLLNFHINLVLESFVVKD